MLQTYNRNQINTTSHCAAASRNVDVQGIRKSLNRNIYMKFLLNTDCPPVWHCCGIIPVGAWHHCFAPAALLVFSQQESDYLKHLCANSTVTGGQFRFLTALTARLRQESLIKESEVGFLLHSHFHLNPFRIVTRSGWEFMYTAKMKPIRPGCWDKVNAFLILFTA